MSIFCRIFSLQIPLRMYRLQLHRNLVRKAKAKKKVGLVRIHADTYQVSFFVIRFVDYVMYVNMYVCKPTMYFFFVSMCVFLRACEGAWSCECVCVRCQKVLSLKQAEYSVSHAKTSAVKQRTSVASFRRNCCTRYFTALLLA